jgi:hypothetical protein
MKKTIISCIQCSQKLRVPVDRGIIEVTCPYCKTAWNRGITENIKATHEQESVFTPQSGSKGPEHIGTAAGSFGSTKNYADNVILQTERRHGFAAEKANHLYDKFSGNNAKNGTDRLIDGVQIRSKYCASGSQCISDCFDAAGAFKYLNPNDTPMQIEVPSDKYGIKNA